MTNVARIQENKTTRRYELVLDGQLIKSYISRKDVLNYARDNGVTVEDTIISYDAVKTPEVTFNINTRFGFVQTLTELVIKGSVKSFIISGTSGIGKSYGVKLALDAADKKEEVDYTFLKGGNITPRGLFDTFASEEINKEGFILIVDDADSIMSSANSLILKGALDSSDRRFISWTTVDGTTVIEVKCSVIILTNLPKSRIDDAVLSRSFYVNLQLNTIEMIERMSSLLPDIDNGYNLPLHQKQECLDLLDEYKEIANEVNIRTLLKLFAIRKDNEGWKGLATYSLVA
jgi:hypothetical protein